MVVVAVIASLLSVRSSPAINLKYYIYITLTSSAPLSHSNSSENVFYLNNRSILWQVMRSRLSHNYIFTWH